MAKSVARKDETAQWPYIRWKEKRQRWMVDARTKDGGERRFFESKPEAEGFAVQQRTLRQNEGATVFDDRELASYGWTVAQAIRFALEHLRKQAASVPVTEAIERLIKAKAAAGRRKDYCGDLRRRLTRFSDYAGERSIAEVTVTDIEAFLTSLNVAEGTWNTYRRDLVTLWSYATKAGLAQFNEPLKTIRAREIDRPPGILTPAQAAALMKTGTDEDVRALHAIGLFAGLRMSELMQLDWKDVDLAGGFIHVDAVKSKTRSRRLVPILDNLRAWLEPISKPSGKIAQPNFRRRSAAARRKAGFGAPGSETPKEKKAKVVLIEWPDNAMRHSFVSYRLTATGNAAQTALESGHDQAVLFRHYRELTKPKAAKEFFEILPLAG
jgi:integrase